MMNETKPRALFIGQEYQAKTASSNFLTDILSEYYQLDILHVKSKPSVSLLLEKIPQKHYDLFIAWQLMLPVAALKKSISFDRGVFFPMYDAFPTLNIPAFPWIEYADFTIICFCRKLYQKLAGCGFNAFYFQYFMKPHPECAPGDAHGLFFWRRRRDISFATVTRLDVAYPLTAIAYHNAPDPKVPSEPVPERLHDRIQESCWFSQKAELYRRMDANALYLAPRLYEGIGMSFLEAMARGRCVIAPDCATMNEYIVHKQTGLLFDPADPHFDFTERDVRSIQQNAMEYMQKGYQEYLKKIPELLALLSRPAHKMSSWFCCYLLLWCMYRNIFIRTPQRMKKSLLKLVRKSGKY